MRQRAGGLAAGLGVLLAVGTAGIGPARAASIWVAQTSGTTSKLSAVSFADTVHGLAAGDGGVTVRTSNGGQTWGPPVSAGAAHGYAVGDGGVIVATADGGVTWGPPVFPRPRT